MLHAAVADLANGRFGETTCPDVSALTERHICDINALDDLEAVGDVAACVTKSERQVVLIVLSHGLPRRGERKLAADLLRRGVRAYFYWPNESAVELIDSHRIKSYRNHAQFLRLLTTANRVRTGANLVTSLAQRTKSKGLHVARRIRNEIARKRILSKIRQNLKDEMQIPVNDPQNLRKNQNSLQVANLQDNAKKRKLDAAKQLLGTDAGGVLCAPTKERPIQGTGAYVRLDYWANFKSGGSYGHTCFLANAAAAVTADFKCIFANRFELLDKLGVEQILLPHPYPSATVNDLIVYGQKFNEPLAVELEKLNPAYVYERIVLGSIAAAEWCRANDVPYIVEYNGSELAMARSFGTPYANEADLEFLEEYNLRAATLINVVSEPVRDNLVERGLPIEKILVNPNAADPDTYRPSVGDERMARRTKYNLAGDDVVVGFCGTFGGWHGIEVLAEALPEICKLDPRIRILLIGDGNLKHLVRQAVIAHDLDQRVVDLGLVPQMVGAEALSVCDILLSPHAQNIDGKTFFGSPTKLFEYLAVGAAVVASDLAQLGEIMRPSLSVEAIQSGKPVTNERGVLVRPGHPQDLVDAVGALVASEETRAKLGANARRAALANYTWDIHVRNIFSALADRPLEGYVKDTKRESATM